MKELAIEIENAGLDKPIEEWKEEQWARQDLIKKMKDLTEKYPYDPKEDIDDNTKING